MQHIQKAIKGFLKNAGLENGIAQQKAVEIWADVVGEKVANNTMAKSVEHGTLTVETKNPVWRQELLFQKKEIIKTLNKKLKKNIIKEIRFL
ncbi:MAG: hypothetical protein CMG04_06230 [Candidatus Marinimicrobia bacterium]|nr:hypothetical protein [Candidatus Neomarinimicrobiota bacterium]|tara:strand:+ start:1663 stop:1938 length:276 start_codon:yes stop_codon:yes gene_type:complete